MTTIRRTPKIMPRKVIKDYTSAQLYTIIQLLKWMGKSQEEIQILTKSPTCSQFIMDSNKQLIQFVSKGKL